MLQALLNSKQPSWSCVRFHAVCVCDYFVVVYIQDELDNKRCACYWPHKLGPQNQLTIGDVWVCLDWKLV